ncbi:MAG: PilZ domain-containing protein [Candidatus Omnitrophota bacterium]|nr:MAG: PilZ domain-containing protein [Candidatus Omnitrophota bacterium]
MRGILVVILTVAIFGGTAILLWIREKRLVDRVAGELDAYYSMLKDRRKSIRLNKRLSVDCKVMKKPDSRWSVFSKDISGEGICLNMPEILPQDAIVDLDVDIPGEKHIIARGKVVWAKEIDTLDSEGKRQFDSGIKFIKISPKDKDELVNFIKGSLTTTDKGEEERDE